MAGDITLSSAVRNNLLSLQNTADLLGRTQERLATGLKVNSALDDPTAFFTASSLNSRANDLSRLLDSVGNALQTIRAADNGIEAITALVESAQASARQALQSPSAVSTPAAAAQVTGGVLFAADDTAAAAVGTTTLNADVAAVALGALGGGGIAADTNPAVTGTDIGSDATLLSLGFADGDTIALDHNGTTYTVHFEAAGAGNATAGTDDATNEYINLDDINEATAGTTAAAFSDLAAAIDGFAGFSANSTGNQLTITGTAAVDNTITVTDADGGGGAANQVLLSALGLGGALGVQVVEPGNATLGALSGDLTFTIGSNTDTFTFGTDDSSNEISTLAELSARLTALSGGGGNTNATFAINSSQIQATAGSAGDGDITIGGDGAVITALGFTSGQVFEETNTSTGLAAAVSGGETLTFTINGNSDSITFGTDDSSNEVSNRAELVARLAAISGGSGNTGAAFAVTGNNVTATAGAVADGAITISGGTNALAFAGFTGGQVVGTTNAALAGLTQTDFTVNFGSAGDETINFANIDSVSDLDAALAGLVNGTGARTSTGAIQFTGANLTDDIVVGGTVTGTGLTATTTSATAASVANNADRAALEAEFNNLRSQIDQLAADASFNGNNLLNGGNLSVIFNEDGSSSLAINGVTFDSAGLGISAAATDAFQSNASINASLTELDSAIASLRQQSSTFGSNLSVVEIRQDFTKNLVNTLETGAANLTLADANEEGANVLALQTRQQLSSVALSLASQADQNVLRLF